MAQEDVADLLNNMAPDERTLFLEELPAEATRQLLALLTPAGARGGADAARLPREVGRPADDARTTSRSASTGRSARCSTTSARTARTAKR